MYFKFYNILFKCVYIIYFKKKFKLSLNFKKYYNQYYIKIFLIKIFKISKNNL